MAVTSVSRVRTGLRRVGVSLGLVGLLVTAAATSARADTSDSSAATAYQVNGAHTGGQSTALAGPLHKVWSSPVVSDSYSLVYDDVAYVLASDELSALSTADGHTVWGPIDVGGTPIGMTEDGGRVFVQVSGLMTAYAAATGAQDWVSTIPTQYSFSSYPTAGDGYVYTGGAGEGGTVYAFKESNGRLTWTTEVENGDDSSPTVTSTGVYVDYACNQTYDLRPKTGKTIWHYSGPCEGGGGSNTSLFGGQLYAPGTPFDTGYVFDAKNGAVKSGLDSADLIPAFTSTGVEVLDESGTLSAENPATRQVLWTFSGDGTIGSELPVSAGSTVYVATGDGQLYALDAATGAVTATITLLAGVVAPLTVGDGTLLVPTSKGIEAFS